MDFGIFFSLLFFTGFGVYFSFGINIFFSNPKAILNRAFLLLCTALSLWPFGLSLANMALNPEAALLWHRASAAGQIIACSSLFHFTLLLTTGRYCKKRRWRHVLPHLPALFLCYLFSLSNRLSTVRYSLAQTGYGWVNGAPVDGWQIFLYALCGIYLLGSLLLFVRWQPRADGLRWRQPIIVSLAASIVLAALTEGLGARFAPQMPQIGPLIAVIPIGAIYMFLKQGWQKQEAAEPEEEPLLDRRTRERLLYYLALAFLLGGLLSYLAGFVPDAVGGEEYLLVFRQTSVLLFAAGLAFLFTNVIKNDWIKNLVVVAVTVASIPLITLCFMSQPSATVWAFPLVLMIVSLVFDTRLPLFLITAAAVISQILAAVAAPAAAPQIGSIHYYLRIGIFLIAFWLGSVVNGIYMKRLEDNVYQINFQKLISELSFDFVNVSQVNINVKIEKLLYRIGSFFDVDRTYVIITDPKEQRLNYSHEWCKAGIEPRARIVRRLPFDIFPWLQQQLRENKLVYLPDIHALPPDAHAEKRQLVQDQVQSFLGMAIEKEGEVLGFMGFDSVASSKAWSKYHIELLRILANLLADALIRVRGEEKIEHMAYFDHLTGLPNRSLFADRLNQAIQLGKRTERFVGVMFLNLDNFRMVNDMLGHSGGDAVLTEVGRRLHGHLRKTDTVARFTGDEFLIMLNNIREPNDVVTVAEKIMELFLQPFKFKVQELFITASAGIAVYPIDGEDAEMLIENANMAMYKAKSVGKNSFSLCTLDMKEEVKRNMVLSNNLYRAQERDELALYYQPQISLTSGNIVGFEALLRWRHPRKGLIPPGAFIPLAEKNGTISSIGYWALQQAARQNKTWQDSGLPRVRVAVNLSIVQFNDPRIVDQVAAVLKQSGLSPQYLELEITENIAIKEPSYTIGVLERLKNLGVTVAIDDFGIAYSSLSRLKALPVDRLKIDMQFIQGIEHSKKDRAITEVIINLARSLDLAVLAEGVETASQLEFVRQKKCHDVQGFYYYRPMPAEEIEKLLRPKENTEAERPGS